MEYLSHEELQTALFDLLCAFDDFAKENGLRYTLDGGTLLGAARHKGFIPWDDDVDVAMPRPDFERLRAMERDVGGRYRICGPMSESLPYPFVKFCDMTIRCQEPEVDGLFEEYLWVDVFPLDGMPEDHAKADAQFDRMLTLKAKAGRKLLPASSALKALVKAPYQLIASILAPASRDYSRMDRLARAVPFDCSELCRDIVWCTYKRSCFVAADFTDMGYLEFCGRPFSAVTHWDEALTSMYGDYMQLPPEGKRMRHGVVAWRVGFKGRETGDGAK